MNKVEEKRINIREVDLRNLRENTKKLRKAEASLSLLNKDLAEIKDKYLRIAAEFENYQKRSEREKKEIFQYGLENFVLRLIPFDDIFESVLKQIENKPSHEVVHKGLQMLKTEFSKILESAGVRRIISKNSKFDAHLHEASEIIETSDYEEGQIVEEERAGYVLNGKTIRPALVKVATGKRNKDDSKNSSACEN